MDERRQIFKLLSGKNSSKSFISHSEQFIQINDKKKKKTEKDFCNNKNFIEHFEICVLRELFIGIFRFSNGAFYIWIIFSNNKNLINVYIYI